MPTKIGWTDETWNFVSGCTKVSAGCDNCYAEELAERYRGSPAYPNGFDVTLRLHKLDAPLRWKRPRMIFVNSMSDIFHKDIPDEVLKDGWDVMEQADHHIYQVLTKRPHRMVKKVQELGLGLPPHIWLGVSAENQEMYDSRVAALAALPSSIRFISAEPLLGPLDLGLNRTSLTEHGWYYRHGLGCFSRDCIESPDGACKGTLLPGGFPPLDGSKEAPAPICNWVIVGGESGNRRRPMDVGWVRSLRDQCQVVGVPFYYKQGNNRYPGRDREIDGATWDEFPDAAGALIGDRTGVEA